MLEASEVELHGHRIEIWSEERLKGLLLGGRQRLSEEGLDTVQGRRLRTLRHVCDP